MAGVIRNHRRFALSDVRFEGEPVGGATIDAWETSSGGSHWSARVLMSPRDMPAAGSLQGKTRDGRNLRGQVVLSGPGPAPRPRVAVLIEWHGVGPLLDEPPAEDEPLAEEG